MNQIITGWSVDCSAHTDTLDSHLLGRVHEVLRVLTASLPTGQFVKIGVCYNDLLAVRPVHNGQYPDYDYSKLAMSIAEGFHSKAALVSLDSCWPLGPRTYV